MCNVLPPVMLFKEDTGVDAGARSCYDEEFDDLLQASFCLQALVSLETVLQSVSGDHASNTVGPLHDAIMRSTGDESTSGHSKVQHYHSLHCSAGFLPELAALCSYLPLLWAHEPERWRCQCVVTQYHSDAQSWLWQESTSQEA